MKIKNNSVEIVFNDLFTKANKLPLSDVNERVEKLFLGVLDILKSYYYFLGQESKLQLSREIGESAYSILKRIERKEIKNKSEEK